MPLTSGLPVSRVVSVQVSLTTPAITAQSVNTCLMIGSSNRIDSVQRVREFANILEVAAYFGQDSEEYKAALPWFSQNPRPTNLMIGRWVKTASQGKVIGAPLSPSQQRMSEWTSVTNGAFGAQIGAAPVTQITGLTFAGMTNLNAVADAVSTAIGATATVVWNAIDSRFELSTVSTGTVATIGFLTSPTGPGTDISDKLGLSAASSGAYIAPGMAPETALAAAVAADASHSSQWYALVVPEADDDDHQQLAAFAEASDPPHYYGITTSAGGSIVDASTTDIGYILAHFGYNKTAVQFSRTSPYAIMSYLGRILTTQWLGQNTTITQKFKNQPSIAPETITTPQANTLFNKHINVFTPYANGARIVQEGQSASGEFTDTIIGADSLALALQNRLFNILIQQPKVPQTDAGMQLLVNGAEDVCASYVGNGWLGEGTWNAQGFGTLESGGHLANGFYVYAPSMLLQDQGERAARRAPLMQIAAKTAGAIHFADIIVFVNQ